MNTRDTLGGCPGVQYYCNATGGPGYVTVETESLLPALTFLKRRYRVTASKPSPDGVRFVIERRGQ